MTFDVEKYVPWASTSHILYVGDLTLDKKYLDSLTFYEIAHIHRAPTVGQDITDIIKNVKVKNKVLRMGTKGSTSIMPIRPDVSNLEIALIHAVYQTLPVKVIADMLNMTKNKVKKIYSGTKYLYRNGHDTIVRPSDEYIDKESKGRVQDYVPPLPLITITDTSRYWDEETQNKYYGICDADFDTPYDSHYKDLLRRAEITTQVLSNGYASIIIGAIDKATISKRVPIPPALSEKEQEDLSELSAVLWANVSREGGLLKVLPPIDGGASGDMSPSIPHEDSPKIDEGATEGYPQLIGGGMRAHEGATEDNLKVDGGNRKLAEGRFRVGEVYKSVNVYYKTKIYRNRGTDRQYEQILVHDHNDRGYSPPLKISLNLIKILVTIHNKLATGPYKQYVPLEPLATNFISSPSYLLNELCGLRPQPTTSSTTPLTEGNPHLIKDNLRVDGGATGDNPRADDKENRLVGKYHTPSDGIVMPSYLRPHCSNSKCYIPSEPLVYPLHKGPHHFMVYCEKCEAMISTSETYYTKRSCEHIKVSLRSLPAFKGRPSKEPKLRPALYIYVSPHEDNPQLIKGATGNPQLIKDNLRADAGSPKVDMRAGGASHIYYYHHIDYYNIEINTLNLQEFYTNISLPLHKLPWDS